MASIQNGPSYSDLKHLQPDSRLSLAHLLGNVSVLCGALFAASSESWLFYILGQLALMLVFVHAFVLIHEAGHQTLFKRAWANTLIGYYSGFLSLIPFSSWRPVHARHHRYTGWQDLDATTATLVPRPLKRYERVAINLAWSSGAPLFSILYRLQNYWYITRIHSFLNNTRLKRKITINVVVQLCLYGALLYVVGPVDLLILVLPAILLSLACEDILLLSQHTHIPQQLAQGATVKPFAPVEQAQFSRSLRLPNWLSVLLMHFDAHELHHMYPQVPGYHLRQIHIDTPNEVDWITWVKSAKRLSGQDFLFRNRNDTGSSV